MNAFIVIELMDPNWPVIVTDQEGKPKIFEDWLLAKQEADECQQGLVVQI